MKGTPWIAALLALPALGNAAVLAPQDFAFGMPVLTQRDAPGYTVVLPLAVYQDTVRDDLGDLRIFNAHGETVPYTIVQPKPPQPTRGTAAPLPLFPLRGNSRIVINGVTLSVEASGSTLSVQSQSGASNRLVNQYILDGRALNAAVAALQLSWSDGAADYSGRVTLEASDDLGVWTTVVTAAPIANLRANGQTLIENRVPLTPRLAKFWRLSWVGPAPPFDLTSVLAEPVENPVDTLHAALETDGVVDAGDADAYDFDIGAHPPVSRVNLLLPEANMVSSVELSSRRAPHDPWRVVTRGNFYRIKNAGGEQHNAPMEISLDRDRYWRARFSHSATPLPAVRLRAEWVPAEVTFLALGLGPFRLAYGNASSVGAEADLTTLPAATQIESATLGKPGTLGGRAQLEPKPAPFPWQRAGLWAALLLTVGFLGWMAVRLSKEDG